MHFARFRLSPAHRLSFGILLIILLSGSLGFFVFETPSNSASKTGPPGMPRLARVAVPAIEAESNLPSIDPDHPMAQAQVVSSKVEMVFPHFGDGSAQGISMKTTIILVNTSNYPSRGTVRFFSDSGAPVSVTIGNKSASSFDFTFSAIGVNASPLRLETSGTGGLKSGWILVESEQPISGTCSFAILDGAGKLVSDVGVGQADPGPAFTLFADSVGDSNTGVAVVNPDPSKTIDVELILRNSNGNQLKSAPLTLGPRQHKAKFITELFSNVGGISDFEGSLEVRSTGPGRSGEDSAPFTLMSLRTTGYQFTSMPVFTPLDPKDDWDLVGFPHMGDGDFGSLSMATAVVLLNQLDRQVSGHVEFSNSKGQLQNVTIAGQTRSSFDFTIPARGVKRFTTSGTGSAKTGWIRAAVDGPVNGSALFNISKTVGKQLVTEVGVPSEVLRDTIVVVADTSGSFNTGIAVVNPGTEAQDITCTLVDPKKGISQSKQLEPLGPLEHRALFVTELFKEVPGVDEIEGLLSLSGDELLGLPLRSAGEKLTSTPILGATYGFADESLFTPMQTVADSYPGIHWILQHKGNADFSLSRIVISAPQLGLKTDDWDVGQSIGWGYIAADAFGYVHDLRVSAKGSLDFDLLTSNVNGSVLAGTGRMTGGADRDLVIDLNLSAAQPYSFGRAGDVHLFLSPGLIRLPKTATTIETTLYSVSTRPGGEVPVIRKLTQQINATTASSSKPVLRASYPSLWAGGLPALIEGSNLDAETVIVCPMTDGTKLEVPAYSATAQQLEFVIPEGIASGPVQAKNGAGSSNELQVVSLFGPAATLTSEAGAGGTQKLTLGVQQPVGQLALAGFGLSCRGLSYSSTGIAVGNQVGSGEFNFTNSSQEVVVRTTQVGSSSLGLEIVDEDGEQAYAGGLTIDPANPSLTVIEFEPVGEGQPFGADGRSSYIFSKPFSLSLELSGFLRTTSDRQRCEILLNSSPTIPLLPDSSYSSGQFVYLGGN